MIMPKLLIILTLTLLIITFAIILLVIRTPATTTSSRPLTQLATTSSPQPSTTPDCITPPHFTHDFTDTTQIISIIPPVFTVGTGTKHTALINTRGRVPLYLPTDGKLFQGSHYNSEGEGHYLLDFEISCGVAISFDHVSEPITKIKALLPETPKNDSRTEFFNPTLPFTAGELIGYTSGTANAHNWNFGVYNEHETNYLSKNPEFTAFPKYFTAICPFRYYQPTKFSFYRNLFTDSFGDVKFGQNLCN